MRLTSYEKVLKPDANLIGIHQRSRNLSPMKLEALRKTLHDRLRIGMLKSVDNLGCGSPVFMVPKSGGRWRMVVDLVELNDHCEKTAFILSGMEVQLKC